MRLRRVLSPLFAEVRRISLWMAAALDSNRRGRAVYFAREAKRHLDLNELENATFAGEMAVASDAEYGDGYCLLGIAYRRRGDAEKALQVFRRGLAAAPSNVYLWRHFGNLEMERGHYVEAGAAFRRAIDLSGNDVHPRVSLSWCLVMEGRVDEAATVLEQAAAISPEHTEVLERLGSIRYRQGQIDEGVALLSRAVQKPDASAAGHNQLARALAANGRWEEALEQADKAYTMDPSDPEFKEALADLTFDLADADMDAGRYAEAEATYRKALALRPWEPAFYLRLAWALGAQERVDEEDALISRAYDLAPHDHWVLSMFGSMEYRHGRVDEAISVLQRAADLGNDSRSNHHFLALALADAQRLEEAETHARRALELAPDNTDLLDLVEEIREKLAVEGGED